jgi:hypothetical protein
MNTKKYTTVDQIDQRFVWLDKEIKIVRVKVADVENPKRDQASSRVNNLQHEKRLLARRRAFLQTPELL